MDLPHVFKLGKGPEHGHVNCLIDFTRTIHMDIGSIYMVVKIPEHESKLFKNFSINLSARPQAVDNLRHAVKIM